MNILKSKDLFEQSKNYIPGGVNSPVRAFKSVGGNPIFMKSAKGAYMTDVDNNTYIDYINSWGPMILGHRNEEVVDALHNVLEYAFTFGTPTEIELELAKLVCSMAPNIDKIRLVNSGTEACMSALRLARAYTNKDKFIKFEGCYHGHSDSFLTKSGSGVATLNIKNMSGVTKGTSMDTLTSIYNDIESVKIHFENYPNQIGAIIIEPIAGNMGCVLPKNNFLKELKEICTSNNCLLIFDEVMTGFRLAKGGAQESLGIEADIVTYGKVIGGGMPIGAFAAKSKIMDFIAPVGDVYQAGTLSGNPLAVTCGLATLSILNREQHIYNKIEITTQTLKQEIGKELFNKGIAHKINQYGSMMSIHFTDEEIIDFESASRCDINKFNKFFHHLLSQGVYIPPSAFESWFICKEISDKEIDKTLQSIKSF